MLIKNHSLLERDAKVIIKKYINGKESVLGAFEENSSLTFSVTIPRRLGVSGVVLRINRDGEEPTDIPFSYVALNGANDRYETTFSGEKGLCFYNILLLRGADTLFVSSVNNKDFTLSKQSGNSFSLLFYDKDFDTPKWVRSGIIYHVFVDRFNRGKGDCSLHIGEINEDWENGIPQFAEEVGAPLSNDVFFGGNLWGIIEKLDYLSSLGVNIIYLSPIFESASNHRYDTGDYEKTDSLLGGDKAFDALVEEAHKRGMKIILDGVFNHTGDDSKYFNKRENYNSLGAFQGDKSPYWNWFNFTDFPNGYEAWWGIEIMPRLKHESLDCRKYFTGNDGIVKRWLERGADGWRLDVADELSDDFLDELNLSAKSTKDAFIIGEVWENAITKISYGKRRRYFHGKQLDSVMNYPFRNALLSLLINKDTLFFYNTVTELYCSYPKPVLNSLMNVLSTHDTERILTLLGDGGKGEGKSNRELSVLRLSEKEKKRAKKLLKIASLIQYTIFGIPSLYYGDEAGVEGYHDPFSRMPFPWGREDEELIKHYKKLGALRKKYDCLKDGDFEFIERTPTTIAYRRKSEKDTLTVIIDLEQETAKIS